MPDKYPSFPFGIGIDIEDIDRFRKLDFGQNENFYQKIFAKEEIAYCLGQKDPYPHFAARFCAKEAFIKACGNKNIAYRSIVISLDNCKPCINYKDIPATLSLSHDAGKAVAVVIVAQ